MFLIFCKVIKIAFNCRFIDVNKFMKVVHLCLSPINKKYDINFIPYILFKIKY